MDQESGNRQAVEPESFVAGYHLVDIKKGQLGELSKVQEELDELTDAFEQRSNILMAVEAADLYGAVAFFLEKHLPELSLDSARWLYTISGPGEGTSSIGELSRIQQELTELSEVSNALQQEPCVRRILMGLKAADLLGALDQFLKKHLPGVSMTDLRHFSSITSRAFQNGQR